MMSFFFAPRKLSKLALASTLLCVGAFGQGTSTSTMTLDRFTHEMTLPLGQIGFSGTLNVPANVVQSVQGGALEIRQRAEFIKATNFLRIRHFLVAPQSPNPTPEAGLTNVFDDYLVSVRSVQTYSNPSSIVIMGVVEQLNTSSPFGQIQGAPVIYSAGYTLPSGTATTTRFNDVALLMPGRLATYGQSSTGTLSFGTTGGGGGQQPQTGPRANAGADISTAQSEISLDGSQSTHSDANESLTYRWRVVSGAANVVDPASIRPRVQLAGNFGTYVFELTVTDSTGATSTDTVSVTYSGRF